MSIISQWQLLILAAATAVNVLVAYRIRRLWTRSEGAEIDPAIDSGGPPDGDPPPGDRVECPACGVENEAGYRFCRECLSELPGAARSDPETADPLGGLTR